MSANHDEKEFLALLQAYGSDETRKARRNSSTISFIVICAWLLGVRLNDVRVFGADISRSSEALVLTLCLILLAYWLGMFIVSWMHDREIEKERKIQGQQAADALLSRFERLKDLKEKNAHANFVPQDYGEVKRAVDGYNRQRLRTAKAQRYGQVIRIAELYVPVFLALAAATVLAVGIHRAL